MERKINKFLRKWLGIPPSFTTIGLYIRSGQLQLPLSSLVEEFKVAKCRLTMTYRDSKDQSINEAGITTRSGRKWAASNAIKEAESSLRTRDIVGLPCIGRQGLGANQFQPWTKAGPKERRGLVQAEVRSLEDEGRRAKAVEQGSQGAWTRWDLPKRKITWADLWRLEPFRISFLLRAVYDTLPSPVCLHRWGMRDDPSCMLCGKRGTLAHVLSGCKTSLTQGRYRWRHDRVLLVLADILERERVKKHQPKTKRSQGITFMKEGAKPVRGVKSKFSLLQ